MPRGREPSCICGTCRKCRNRLAQQDHRLRSKTARKPFMVDPLEEDQLQRKAAEYDRLRRDAWPIAQGAW